MQKLRSIEELAATRAELISTRDPDQVRVTICCGTGCRANGSFQLAQKFAAELAAFEQTARVELKLSGCHGFCQQGPVVVINPAGIFYRQVGIEDRTRDIREIIERTLIKGEPVERLLYVDPQTGKSIEHYEDIPFYARQVRVALADNGRIDPNSLEDYIHAGGYAALSKVLSTDPAQVIEWISASGLRGRGGGGFPTGTKWKLCRNAGDKSARHIICNADEGDPGAFMDRSIMEGDPFSVLEGMTIGAYAMARGICQPHGHIYIRAEYPLAVQNVRTAIRKAEEAGLLGDSILGTDFSLHVSIKEGAGAFVCGEETSLIASLEGRRGTPRTRPPFPANKGLFGQPSNINNVETWANIPRIVVKGPEWYAGMGTKTSAGTKVFSLVGKVRNSGLVEVPMGISLKEIVFDIGGGIPDNKRIKAVQTGGPSGGCIPANMLDMPVDYEKLAEAGAIMGSGGMVVMDEDTCMVDIARYFVEFTQSESCGKCVPCRLGTKQMLEILNRITSGDGEPGDIELLLELCDTIKKGSLCGLGQTAPNPVLTTIRYFRDEYEAHIRDKKCAAAVCRGLVKAPCTHICPAGVDVPRYLRCIADARFADALDVIRERIPFPSVCGYVCFHPCETKCRRSQLDDPLAVRALKRFAAERGRRKRRRRVPKAPPTDRKIAVIGSGPAGMTAAYYLGKLGHKVTVFERDPEPGGTLRTGIPAFRLPRSVIDNEIEDIRKASGIRLRTGTTASPKKLLKRGYNAVLLACGAQKGLKTGIRGEENPRVFDCLSYLRKVNAGDTVAVGRRVAVIGGGSSAMDAARTALRNGAEEVTIIYRRAREDMPAAREEIEEAVEEGVELQFLVSPVAIEQKDGELVLQCVRMEPGPMDRSGRALPVPIEGSSFELAFHSIIMAVGQAPEDISGSVCETDRSGRVKVAGNTMQTTEEGVFAAGDVVTGPASVIEAIAAGRRAALTIDRFLGGTGKMEIKLAPPEDVDKLSAPEEEQEVRPRSPIPKRPANERVGDSEPVELLYAEEAAIAEARRCLRCDLEKEEEDL